MELYETGEFELTASRAKYQHYKLANTTIRTTAMQEIKDSMDQIRFEQPDNIDDPDRFLKVPVPYAYMYIQWEANRIISDELIRNLSLTFATIAVVSLLLIINLQVSLKMAKDEKIRENLLTIFLSKKISNSNFRLNFFLAFF